MKYLRSEALLKLGPTSEEQLLSEVFISSCAAFARHSRRSQVVRQWRVDRLEADFLGGWGGGIKAKCLISPFGTGADDVTAADVRARAH